MSQSGFFRRQQRQEFDSDESDQENRTWTQNQIDQVLGIPAGWEDRDPSIFVYIDDANAVEKCRIPGSITTISQDKQKVRIHAEKSEELFKTVSLRASEIKMRVNQKKNTATMRFSKQQFGG